MSRVLVLVTIIMWSIYDRTAGKIIYAKTTIEGFEKTVNISEIETETIMVGSQETESLTTALGIDVSYAIKTNERLQKIRLGVLIPQIRDEWVMSL